MLKQASVSDIKRGAVERSRSYVVITMRYYPRFLRKEFRDEFLCELAPVKELLKDFNEAQKRLDNHNKAFPAVDYESRFDLPAKALHTLQRLAEKSRTTDVYLVCICALGERCHREMLMLLAKDLFGCPIGEVFHSYPTFAGRFPEFQKKAASL